MGLLSIDPTTRTLLVTGYPNLGKSSFINRAPQRTCCLVCKLFEQVRQPKSPSADRAVCRCIACQGGCLNASLTCVWPALWEQTGTSPPKPNCKRLSLLSVRRGHACGRRCAALRVHDQVAICGTPGPPWTGQNRRVTSVACVRRGHSRRRGCAALRVHDQVPVCGAPGSPLPALAGHRHAWHPRQAAGGA